MQFSRALSHAEWVQIALSSACKQIKDKTWHQKLIGCDECLHEGRFVLSVPATTKVAIQDVSLHSTQACE